MLPWSDFISVFCEFFLSFLFGLFLSTTAGSICFLLAESSFLDFPFYFYFPSSTIFYFDLSPVSYLAFDLSFWSKSFAFFPLVSTSFCFSFSLSLSFYLSFYLFLPFTEGICLSFLSYSGTPIIFLSLFRIRGLFLFNPRLFLGFPCSLCVYSITGVVVYLISSIFGFYYFIGSLFFFSSIILDFLIFIISDAVSFYFFLSDFIAF